MNIVIEEVVSEFPVLITEEVFQITISDAVSYFDIVEVADTSFVGKNGYVPVVTTGKIVLQSLQQVTSSHNALFGLNLGNYIHLTALEKTKFDNLPNTFAPVDAEKNVNADWSSTSGDSEILNKPSSFPPSAHSHVESDITDLDKYTKLEVDNFLGDKVDKVSGKGFSTEDYTTAEKSKLSGIEAGAEVNNISDTDATDLTDGGETTLHHHDSRYYTETEVNNLLDDKFDAPTGNNTQYLDGAGVPTTLPTVPTKTSDLINDGDNGISHFISLEDLPSNLILYPTTASSDISGYNKLVIDIHDADFDNTAVDINTGSITTTSQLISSLATVPSLIIGNPGVFNITVIGNIRKISGSGSAEFYFQVYKRSGAGVETLIGTSDTTSTVDSVAYTEFSATALWDDGEFISTDRIVLKFYANRVAGGSNPNYQFQFGGTTPVRTLVPIALSTIGYTKSEIDVFLDSKQDNLGFTPANKAGDTFTGNIFAPNLSGTNTGDETTSTIQTKRPLKTLENQSLEGFGNISILAKTEILSLDPISPQIGQSWVTEYNSTDGEVIGLGLLFTYVESTTLEAHYKIKGTNEIITIN